MEFVPNTIVNIVMDLDQIEIAIRQWQKHLNTLMMDING